LWITRRGAATLDEYQSYFSDSYYRALISHEVKRHIECCNCTPKNVRFPQSPVGRMSYANPYATYKLGWSHDSKSRVSERRENDYTQGLI